jgi:hypothetical protein
MRRQIALCTPRQICRYAPASERRIVHYALMDPSLPKIELSLWRADAIVLFDWLMTVDLDSVPTEHPAGRQALADLLTRLEGYTDIPYGASGTGLTQDEIDAARAEVAKDVGLVDRPDLPISRHVVLCGRTKRLSDGIRRD